MRSPLTFGYILRSCGITWSVYLLWIRKVMMWINNLHVLHVLNIAHWLLQFSWCSYHNLRLKMQQEIGRTKPVHVLLFGVRFGRFRFVWFHSTTTTIMILPKTPAFSWLQWSQFHGNNPGLAILTPHHYLPSISRSYNTIVFSYRNCTCVACFATLVILHMCCVEGYLRTLLADWIVHNRYWAEVYHRLFPISRIH